MYVNSEIESSITPIETVEGDFEISGKPGSYQV